MDYIKNTDGTIGQGSYDPYYWSCEDHITEKEANEMGAYPIEASSDTYVLQSGDALLIPEEQRVIIVD